MYLISVYFDEKTNQKLNRYISKIAEKTGNDFMTSNHVPPHMTIAAIEARNVEVLRPAFEGLKDKINAGEISIASVGAMFPSVIYAAPVLNEYLQGLVEVVNDAYTGIPEVTVNRYYRPYSWVPHITLGKTLSKEEMVKAFQVMQEDFGHFKARVVRIGLAKVNPHEDVAEWELEI